MKKNNSLSFATKAKILTVIMSLLATMGFAKEREGVVVRQIDQTGPNGSIYTQILIATDTSKNGRPDLSFWLNETDSYLFTMLLKEYLPVGTIITYEDSKVNNGNSINYMSSANLMSINGEDILEFFPTSTWFEDALAKRARQRSGQSSIPAPLENPALASVFRPAALAPRKPDFRAEALHNRFRNHGRSIVEGSRSS